MRLAKLLLFCALALSAQDSKFSGPSDANPPVSEGDLRIVQRDELANEILLAAEVQQSILPRSIPRMPGFEFAARMYPAKIVAGDYYGFIELPKGEIAVVIADVAGKGVAAGLLMPSIEVTLRMDASRFPGTNDLLHAFNNVVHQVTGGHRFIFLFYGRLSIAFPRIHERRT